MTADGDRQSKAKSIERRLCELRERLRRIRADYKGVGAGFDLERELVLTEDELEQVTRSVSDWFKEPTPEDACRAANDRSASS